MADRVDDCRHEGQGGGPGADRPGVAGAHELEGRDEGEHADGVLAAGQGQRETQEGERRSGLPAFLAIAVIGPERDGAKGGREQRRAIAEPGDGRDQREVEGHQRRGHQRRPRREHAPGEQVERCDEEHQPEERVDVLAVRREAEHAVVEGEQGARQGSEQAQAQIRRRPPGQDAAVHQRAGLTRVALERVEVEGRARDGVLTIEHRPLQVVVGAEPGVQGRPVQPQGDAADGRERERVRQRSARHFSPLAATFGHRPR